MDESQTQPQNTDSANARAPAPPARRRRWLQFSIRSLLLLTLLCAAGAYAWRTYLEPYRQQRQTMALIEKLGGSYETSEASAWLRRIYGGDFQNVVLVNLGDCDDPSAYLAQIATLPALETLVVGGRAFTDEHLLRLQRLKTLQGLVLDSTSVTEEGLAALSAALPHADAYRSQRRAIASLRQVADVGSLRVRQVADVDVKPSPAHARLHDLLGDAYFEKTDLIWVFPGSELSEAHWAHLENLVDLQFFVLRGQGVDKDLVHIEGLKNLQMLDLNGTRVGDAGLVHVKNLPQLRSLYLNGTEVGDAGLAHLSELRNLERLDLETTKVTDAGLRHLKGMTNLQFLVLAKTQVGDAGLAHLQGLNKLQALYLYDTRITDLGLAHLKGMGNLKQLFVGRTKVTAAGIEQLKRALPKCVVH